MMRECWSCLLSSNFFLSLSPALHETTDRQKTLQTDLLSTSIDVKPFNLFKSLSQQLARQGRGPWTGLFAKRHTYGKKKNNDRAPHFWHATDQCTVFLPLCLAFVFSRL